MITLWNADDHMEKSKLLVILGVCLVTFFWFCLPSTCFAADVNEANDALILAEEEISLVYLEVANAEAEGADISNLLNKIKTASVFLSNSHIAFRSGDYDLSIISSLNCMREIEGVFEEATHLKLDSQNENNNNQFSTALFSGVGVVLVVVLGFVGWKIVRNKYFRNILEATPKVERSI